MIILSYHSQIWHHVMYHMIMSSLLTSYHFIIGCMKYHYLDNRWSHIIADHLTVESASPVMWSYRGHCKVHVPFHFSDKRQKFITQAGFNWFIVISINVHLKGWIAWLYTVWCHKLILFYSSDSISGTNILQSFVEETFDCSTRMHMFLLCREHLVLAKTCYCHCATNCIHCIILYVFDPIIPHKCK